MSFLSNRFPRTQFIVTAHSPLVVQAADDANVVLLKREGDHVLIQNNPQDIRNWRIDQILTSDLYGLPTARSPRLDALIAQRRAILTKAEISIEDRKRLSEIEMSLGDLPAGQTPEEMRAIDLILRAAATIAPVKRKKAKARAARKRS